MIGWSGRLAVAGLCMMTCRSEKMMVEGEACESERLMEV